MADEKRVRRNLRSGTLGALLAAGAGSTTITFASDPQLPTLPSDAHLALVVEQEIMYLTDYTTPNLTGTVVREREGTTSPSHANGTAWRHVPTVRDFAVGRLEHYFKTSGDFAPTNTTTWSTVDTGGDLTIACFENDIVEVGMSAFALSASSGTEMYLDVVTRPSGSSVSSIGQRVAVPSTTGMGIQAWRIPAVAAINIGGSVLYRMGASDVSGSNQCTFRWRYRYPTASGTRTFKCDADQPLHWWVRNHGPQEALV